MLRHAEPVGRGLGALSPAPRLQGAGDDQRRRGLEPRPRRWRGPLDAMLAHIGTIAEASDVPVNADFGNGFADAPDDVGRNVSRVVETGVAGLLDRGSDPRDGTCASSISRLAHRGGSAAIDAAGGEMPSSSPARSAFSPATHGRARRRSSASGNSRKPAPTACSRRECGRATTFARSSKRSRRSRSTCSSAGRAILPSPISPPLACAGSASAARWRGRRGAASSGRPRTLPTTGVSRRFGKCGSGKRPRQLLQGR